MDALSPTKAMCTAIRSNDTDQVLILLRKHEGLVETITHLGSWLHFAAINGQLDIVKCLLDFGIDVNTEGFEEQGNALDRAAARGHLDIVKYLHEQGGVLDTSESQRNPLFATIISDQPHVARYLIGQGIDVTPKYQIGDVTDMDARKFAWYWGRSEIREMIEQRLADLGEPMDELKQP